MLAVVPSATLHGLDGRLIRVEVDVAPGLPGFTIVGLADAALQEARERVRGALRNAGFVYPPGRIALIGELSLGGEVRAVPGILPMVAALVRRGLRRVALATAAVDEARLV